LRRSLFVCQGQRPARLALPIRQASENARPGSFTTLTGDPLSELRAMLPNRPLRPRSLAATMPAGGPGPSQTRYPEPSHFTTSKTVADRTRMRDSPKADCVACRNTPQQLPSVVKSPALRPRAITFSSVSAPGVMVSRPAIAAKAESLAQSRSSRSFFHSVDVMERRIRTRTHGMR
jgi:hypothetical protein